MSPRELMHGLLPHRLIQVCQHLSPMPMRHGDHAADWSRTVAMPGECDAGQVQDRMPVAQLAAHMLFVQLVPCHPDCALAGKFITEDWQGIRYRGIVCERVRK